MRKEASNKLIGNDQYEGFGIDLIECLSEMLGFNYTFILQDDGANGSYNRTTGTWDGMLRKIKDGVSSIILLLVQTA